MDGSRILSDGRSRLGRGWGRGEGVKVGRVVAGRVSSHDRPNFIPQN